MGIQHRALFVGKTGRIYPFELYQDLPIFHRARPCTYMLLKRNTRSIGSGGSYQPIHIGETAHFDELLVDPQYDRLLTSGDFDLIAIHEQKERLVRLAHMLDLLQAYFPMESKNRFLRQILISKDDWKKLNDYMQRAYSA